MDIDYIKTANTVRGKFFFQPATMRFFQSRILADVYEGEGGVFFVTSEKGPDNVRRYSVREFLRESGNVATFGAFQGYKTARAAKGAAKRAAASRSV